MSTLTITWDFDDLDDSIQDAGYQRNPRWPLVEHLLYQLKFRAGSVELDISDKSGEGAFLINVLGDEDKYYPTLLYRKADGNVEIRVHDDKKKGTEPVTLRRDSHYACNICEDFSLIHRMFKEFYDTGDVSEELLRY
jgi:hypothetical protein